MVRALDDESGFGVDRFGTELVLAAYRPLAYQDASLRKWGMVVKIDRQEAFQPVSQLNRLMLIIVSGLLLLGLAGSYAVARHYTRPISQLAESAARVAGVAPGPSGPPGPTAA